MKTFLIKQIILNTQEKKTDLTTHIKGYELKLTYISNQLVSYSEILLLPLKETVYLCTWLEINKPFGRINAKELGYLKAANLAWILSVAQIKKPRFESDYEAYLFFKHHIDERWLRLLLGIDFDEVVLKLEKSSRHNVLGGYLGGETESKDKTRFKSFLKHFLKNKDLMSQLIPSQIKDEREKRVLNQFQLNIEKFQII